jgi:hypothetical protein
MVRHWDLVVPLMQNGELALYAHVLFRKLLFREHQISLNFAELMELTYVVGTTNSAEGCRLIMVYLAWHARWRGRHW